MTDFKRVKSTALDFARAMRELSNQKVPLEREELKSLRVRYWYERLRQRTGLSTAYQLEQYFEEESFKRDDQGRVEFYRNKWKHYEHGKYVPTKALRVIEAKSPGSTRDLQHPLWIALDISSTSIMKGDDFLRKLNPTVQELIFEYSGEGFGSHLNRLRITQKILNRMERSADLDVLACLVWLLREASQQNDLNQTQMVFRTLHNTLLILSVELHTLKVALPLLKIFIDDILPLGLEENFSLDMDLSDYTYASAYLNLTVFQTNRGCGRSLSFKQRAQIMHWLLQGGSGMDIPFAMQPKLKKINDSKSSSGRRSSENTLTSRSLYHMGWTSILRENFYAILEQQESENIS